MCQNLWKKIGWKPSGPGALYGLKDLNAAAISCLDISSQSFQIYFNFFVKFLNNYYKYIIY